jgi:general secretion pathway protein K
MIPRKTNLAGTQQGVALLTVLFILVLLSTLAVYTAEDENIAIRRAENQRDMAQAYQVALAGEQWIRKALERDLLNAPSEVDYFGDEWALLGTQVVSVEDGQMVVQAVDESGKFNLNNLLVGKMVDKPGTGTATSTPVKIESVWYRYFTRLLANSGLEEELADAVVDWLDADDERTEPDGAEDNVYLSGNPPYLAANQPFFSVAELAQVEGFDQEKLAILWPSITALPVDPERANYTKINLNTAPPMVLASLNEDSIDNLLVGTFLVSRKARRFDQISSVYSALALNLDLDEFNEISSVGSSYFSAHSCARFGRINIAMKSLLYRDTRNKEVAVISRQRRYNCAVLPPDNPSNFL